MIETKETRNICRN